MKGSTVPLPPGDGDDDCEYSPGVLGMNPEIESKQSFQYMSCANITSPRGSMEGKFLFRNMASGSVFEVVVGHCKLNPEVSSEY
jgi:uncharacterized protein affecting Mg2+/Co2+ transport